MADNSRRYNLDVCSLISYGIGSSGSSYQCTLLEEFTVGIDGTVCDYPAITSEALGYLTVPAYEERVSDYLEYINIESDITKQRLIDEAQDDDPLCADPCGLNPSFLVYLFLDGVRVINIGEVRGEAQYSAYEVGTDPNLATWQTHGTFLNLDLSKIYVFEVRDWFEYAEYCIVQQVRSLPLLVPSTTYIAPDVTVYFNETASANPGSFCYATGYVCAEKIVGASSVPLSGIERVKINFDTAAYASGDASSAAQITCQTGGVGAFDEIYYITNNDFSPQSSSFIMNAADIVRYTISTTVPTCGSCGCSCIDMTSVDGLSTTVPTINLSCCCVSVLRADPPLSISVVTSFTTSACTSTSCTKSGRFLFNGNNNADVIPAGQEIALGLLEEVTVAGGGTGTAELWCKPDGGLFVSVFNHNQTNPQPFATTINVHHGDELCYKLTSNVASAGATTTSEFTIPIIDASYGINPIIGTPHGDSITQSNAAVPFVVAMCKINEYGGSGSDYHEMNGYINVTEAGGSAGLSGSQCVVVNLMGMINVTQVGSGTFGLVSVSCLVGGVGSWIPVLNFKNPPPTGEEHFTGGVTIRANDQICWDIEATILYPNTIIHSELALGSVSGQNGVSATVCSSKSIYCVDAEVGIGP